MRYESDVLQGRDFNPDVELSVNDQVEKLIVQATAVENLCQCFLGAIATQMAFTTLICSLGWCAFW
jgi:hypothetical protein